MHMQQLPDAPGGQVMKPVTLMVVDREDDRLDRVWDPRHERVTRFLNARGATFRMALLLQRFKLEELEALTAADGRF
jgi:N-formylglutamate amidohydrolase